MGFIPLLLFPLLSLGLGGYLTARQNNLRTAKETLPVSACIGAGYGLFLLVLSFFAGFAHKIDTTLLFRSVQGSVEYSFSSLGALFMGILIGAAFSWVGMRLYGRKDRKAEAPALPHPAKEALLAAGQGWTVASVLMFIILLANMGEGMSFWAVLLLMPQLGSYAWGVANLGKLSLVLEGEKVTASIWSGVGSAGSGADTVFSSGGYQLLARLMVLIALAFLVWAGRQLAARQGTGRKSLIRTLQFSLVYGLSTAVLAFVSRVGLTVYGGAFNTDAARDGMTAGVDALPVFLSSFVLAFAVIYACAALFKGNTRRFGG